MPAVRQSEVPSPLVRRLNSLPDPERAFVHLYGQSRSAFWFDSSAGSERSRFSFIGDSEGPLAAVVTYDVEAGEVRVERAGGVEVRFESIFDYLGRELERLRPPSAELPFDFECGFGGYLGYELKAECDAAAAHRASTPDAAFILADRLIAFDHQERHTYLLAQAPAESELHQILGLAGREFDAVRFAAEAERWIDEMEDRLGKLPALAESQPDPSPPKLTPLRSREHYHEDIEACKRYLTAGHSYEICLTNTLETETDADPLELYRALRRANPAPFAAYLRFGDLAVLSSSPERFLSIDRDGRAEARPIKGTARRGATPVEDARLAAELSSGEKSRAENVTIVDLMRNDLGRVCEIGSIDVPELMAVESYETVHQLVSSISGRLRPDLGPLDAVRACFPPGSMTGAPKRRTMEIIDELEGAARGVYSGAIGWFGLGGACDLSVAIRTIVLDGERATIGAGGAIVIDSDPREELAEMMLKARASTAAFSCAKTHLLPKL
ncbi:MAG TPA: aminodeoxychorismate synthase component I [Solirubrobacterales bacterium]|nr:aminodeoxychorismate synthase component I [Solirubrobacterales bacterium]